MSDEYNCPPVCPECHRAHRGPCKPVGQAHCAPVPGSASEIIIAELTGKPIRKLDRERMLQTGDRLSNKFGQELWTVVACHPKGVRVSQWPMGDLADYTWEQLYCFYERVPAELPGTL